MTQIIVVGVVDGLPQSPLRLFPYSTVMTTAAAKMLQGRCYCVASAFLLLEFADVI
jgi:hypothetical protein